MERIFRYIFKGMCKWGLPLTTTKIRRTTSNYTILEQYLANGILNFSILTNFYVITMGTL